VTLSPVFRSEDAVAILRSEGVWDRFKVAAEAQSAAVRLVKADLLNVLDATYVRLDEEPQSIDTGTVALEFVQEFFFLIFFRSVLESVGSRQNALDLYSEVNFCVKGAITAADNLFDDQQKQLLPLRSGAGPRFGSILQLLTFERLLQRTLDRAVRAGLLSQHGFELIQRELLSRMAAIGALEGSEERGVDEVLGVDEMIERVHRVRGGALFELALVVPRQVEGIVLHEALARVENAFSRLGTAFQMVDDLTDFEFDFARGRQNLLVAQICHHGGAHERAALAQIRQSRGAAPDVVETRLRDSARTVLDRAIVEARGSLDELHALGFWLSPSLAEQLVRAIVGLDGVTRMKALSS
jgi:hypothetical protein